MKENKSIKTKIVDLASYSSDDVGLLVQVVLIELLIIFAVINLITNIFMPAFYAILAMLMFSMAYNNIKVYKRKYMTVVYLVVGIFVTVATILEYMV